METNLSKVTSSADLEVSREGVVLVVVELVPAAAAGVGDLGLGQAVVGQHRVKSIGSSQRAPGLTMALHLLTAGLVYCSRR